MSWGWNKYRETHAEAVRDRELREKFPNWERQLEERTRNLEADLSPAAESVPEEPATPPPEAEESAGNYPWGGAEDSD